MSLGLSATKMVGKSFSVEDRWFIADLSLFSGYDESGTEIE